MSLENKAFLSCLAVAIGCVFGAAVSSPLFGISFDEFAIRCAIIMFAGLLTGIEYWRAIRLGRPPISAKALIFRIACVSLLIGTVFYITGFKLLSPPGYAFFAGFTVFVCSWQYKRSIKNKVSQAAALDGSLT